MQKISGNALRGHIETMILSILADGAAHGLEILRRLDDAGQRGMDMIEEAVQIFETFHLPANVLAASIRSPRHVTDAALAGAHVATIPPNVLFQMIHHPLTDLGIERFLADAEQYSPV